MRLPFSSVGPRPNKKDRPRAPGRRAIERRFGQSIEILEPRWVLVASSWESLYDLAEQAGREYASDRISLGFETPATLQTSHEARQYLANAARNTPFEALAEEFELAFSYTRADATNLAVGDVILPAEFTVRQALDALRGSSFIEWAQPDYLTNFTPELIPSDPVYADQAQFLARIKAPQAWDVTTGHGEVVVAVIDTGVRWKHEDFYAAPHNNSACGRRGHEYVLQSPRSGRRP
jgi:hypothetical protein